MTERVRLGTTVLVLPYLNPLVLAKTIATLDVMSGGRVSLGVGVGMLREENDALGSDFTTRGAYADESIEVMRDLDVRRPELQWSLFRLQWLQVFTQACAVTWIPILIRGMQAALYAASREAGRPHGTNGGSVTDRENDSKQSGRVPEFVRALTRSPSSCAANSTPGPPVRQPIDPMIGIPDQYCGPLEGSDCRSECARCPSGRYRRVTASQNPGSLAEVCVENRLTRSQQPAVNFDGNQLPPPWGATGAKYANLIPAEAGIQGIGVSFDKLRTNELSVYLPL